MTQREKFLSALVAVAILLIFVMGALVADLYLNGL